MFLAKLSMRTYHLNLGSWFSDRYSHTLWAELSQANLSEDFFDSSENSFLPFFSN